MQLTLNAYFYVSFERYDVLQKKHPQSPETKIELQPYQQKSLKVLTAATDSSSTDVQSTEKSTNLLLVCDTVIIIIMLTLMHCR